MSCQSLLSFAQFDYPPPPPSPRKIRRFSQCIGVILHDLHFILFWHVFTKFIVSALVLSSGAISTWFHFIIRADILMSCQSLLSFAQFDYPPPLPSPRKIRRFSQCIGVILHDLHFILFWHVFTKFTVSALVLSSGAISTWFHCPSALHIYHISLFL